MTYLLDYSDVDAKISSEDKVAFWHDFEKNHRFKFQRYISNDWFWVAMISIFLIVTLTGALMTYFVSWQAFGTWIIANIIFFAICIGTRVRRQTQRRIKIHRLGKQNNIETIIAREGKTKYSGLIFDDALEAQITEAVRFNDGLEIGTFQYFYGGGRSRWLRTFGYMRMPIKKHLPNMLLDSRANNTFKFYTGFTSMYSGHEQRDSLEGDFDKHFRLFAPGGYEIDTRYLLTPDVMAAFIDYGSEYDFEIIDDHIQLYSRRKINILSSNQMAKLLKIAEVVSLELGHQAKQYRDDRSSNGALEINGIALEGRRLKPSLWMLFVYLSILGVAFYVIIFT